MNINEQLEKVKKLKKEEQDIYKEIDKYYLDQGFDTSQVDIIIRNLCPDYHSPRSGQGTGTGYKKLDLEQTYLLINKEFDWLQMYEIESGFSKGLSINEVKIYAKKEYNPRLMQKIREILLFDIISKEYKDLLINLLIMEQ